MSPSPIGTSASGHIRLVHLNRCQYPPLSESRHAPHSLRDISSPDLAGYFSEFSTIDSVDSTDRKTTAAGLNHRTPPLCGVASRNMTRSCPQKGANRQNSSPSPYF